MKHLQLSLFRHSLVAHSLPCMPMLSTDVRIYNKIKSKILTQVTRASLLRAVQTLTNDILQGMMDKTLHVIHAYLFFFQIAVLIANGIAQLLQPSVYDSIIQIKKLPYLPDILTATSGAYNIYVEDFMVRDVKYIWYGITYRQLKNILKEHKKIRSLPLVDSPGKVFFHVYFLKIQLFTFLECAESCVNILQIKAHTPPSHLE